MATNLFDVAKYVQDQGELGRQRKVRNLLTGAASQAYGADPATADAAVRSAIAADPEAGFQLAGNVADDQDRRGQQIYNMARGLKQISASSPEAAKAFYESQLVPGLRRLGFEVQDSYDEARVMPVVDQVLAQFGSGAGGTVQSTYIDRAGDRIAIMRDGSTQNLGPAEQRLQLRDQPGIAPGAFDPRTGRITAVTEGAPLVPAGVESSGRQVSVGADVDPAVAAAIRANPDAFAALPEVSDVQIQPRSTGVAAARPEIDAGERERLRLANEANLRDIGRYDLAVQQEQRAQREEARKVDANAISGRPPTEDERKAVGWLNQASRAVQNMEQALADDPEADIPGVIETYSPVEEVRNRSRSDARQRYVNAASSASEAILRAATGAGVNQDEARQKIAELTPQRGDTDSVRKQKLAGLKGYLGDLRARAGRAAQQSQGSAPAAAAAPVRARNPQTGEVVELRNGQWVPVNG
ncbi:hypothetical protein ACHZ97_14595 [Lysobacter soli]|uniref:hypothetical protein n=1 Tax=Lysobacter soli TaxID=453783 RepID=UPI0037CC70F2